MGGRGSCDSGTESVQNRRTRVSLAVASDSSGRRGPASMGKLRLRDGVGPYLEGPRPQGNVISIQNDVCGMWGGDVKETKVIYKEMYPLTVHLYAWHSKLPHPMSSET